MLVRWKKGRTAAPSFWSGIIDKYLLRPHAKRFPQLAVHRTLHVMIWIMRVINGENWLHKLSYVNEVLLREIVSLKSKQNCHGGSGLSRLQNSIIPGGRHPYVGQGISNLASVPPTEWAPCWSSRWSAKPGTPVHAAASAGRREPCRSVHREILGKSELERFILSRHLFITTVHIHRKYDYHICICEQNMQ